MDIMAHLTTDSRPDYSLIAEFYYKHWCEHYHPGLLAMLNRLLLTRLAPGARVLDVCCGTGTVARSLVRRGFRVTGVDASEEMLRYSIRDVPEAEFLAADARAFRLPSVFDAAICTFDSLSYFIGPHDLDRVFSNVNHALQAGGLFVFDVSLEEAYKGEWGRSCSIVENDEAYFVRGSYDDSNRIGRTLITGFHRNGGWVRNDVQFLTRCHGQSEILDGLTRAGFTDIQCHRSDEDTNLRAEIGCGRACFVAAKPSVLAA